MTLTIDTPLRTPPAAGGLLRVANVIPSIPQGAFQFGLQYKSDPCGQNRVIPEEGQDKVADQSGDSATVGFGLYRMVEDALLTGANPEELVKRLYKNGESYGVEAGVQDNLLNPIAVDLTPTPGTALTNMKHALGLLEQYAADNYAGLPSIHGNRLAVSLIPDLQAGDDGSLKTIHGTPISNAGGFGSAGPGAANAAAGKAWLYITGQINIWVEPVRVYPANDLYGNRTYTLAEGRYLAAVECFVAAVLVGA
jgi:hypothetical protein